MRKTLTAALIEKGLITNEQLQEARQRQQGAKLPIQDVIVEMGFVSGKDMLELLSSVLQMPIVDLNREDIDSEVINLISYDTAKRYGVFPLRNEKDIVVLAMSNPQDLVALDDLKLIMNKVIQPFLASKSDIAVCIEKYYHVDDSIYDLLKNLVEDSSAEVTVIESPKESQVAYSPVVRLVKVILSDAIRNRATDIHIEPQENFIEVRYRVDGYLKNILKIPTEMYPQFVARIKIISELNIAENKKPQDGRAEVIFKNRKIDLRVSIIPTYYGEKIVLRVLDPQKSKIEISKIGFTPDELRKMENLFVRPQGMILVTGPTGSGKTSTLYAALGYVKNETKNIITIEDPIEYLMDGVNQIQINVKRDVTFATSLRSVLRQDPDIILVGEIRDAETAEIAFKAALTGHLVFSTLHTNDAVSSISRLYDIGLEAYLIASSVILIIAQRLIRVICSNCKEEYTPDTSELGKFESYISKLKITKFYKGKGCKECGFTGYFGRTAIFEIFELNKKIQDLIGQKVAASVLSQEAQSCGMKSLAESGMQKVALGLTTLEEVSRVAVLDMMEDLVEEQPKRERPLVLVVDDEDNIRKVVGMRLKTAGFDIIEACNGVEAVEKSIRNQPDLIVMDVMMPIMDGFEATKQIRSELKTAAIPIVMLTAKGDANSEVQGLDAGADDYIAKPFDGVRLLARIKLLLKKKG